MSRLYKLRVLKIKEINYDEIDVISIYFKTAMLSNKILNVINITSD